MSKEAPDKTPMRIMAGLIAVGAIGGAVALFNTIGQKQAPVAKPAPVKAVTSQPA